MTRFADSTRSATVRSTPEINNRPRPVPRVRTAGSLVAITASAVVLLLLLIFILQNGQRTTVHFFGANGELPMGVALLLAAVFGVLLVTVQTTTRRVIQLLATRRRRTTPGTRPDLAGTGADAGLREGGN
ncbi:MULTISPECIES: LapA family protein [unclassified Micromonospora]|uniref:lipopolysaccharide assembly protein LapA domain-containing protein n=1 Tax=unclassified Micromonospora TaxID=2617518 RepID=UPI001C2244FE|nr:MULTISPECIES: LapA family protein [unclassified Micromonospora]MBU8858581.1 LapA family protein [Micromonospora sp. WMMB482]MDM4784224.1 LapA family protein [Micromonospora sp. b486]